MLSRMTETLTDKDAEATILKDASIDNMYKNYNTELSKDEFKQIVTKSIDRAFKGERGKERMDRLERSIHQKLNK